MKNMIVVVCALLAFGAFLVSARPANAGELSVSVDYNYADENGVLVGLPYGMPPSLKPK